MQQILCSSLNVLPDDVLKKIFAYVMPSIYNDSQITVFAWRPYTSHGNQYFKRERCTPEDIEKGYETITQTNLEYLLLFKQQFYSQFFSVIRVCKSFSKNLNILFPNAKEYLLTYMPPEVLIKGNPEAKPSKKNGQLNKQLSEIVTGKLIGDITMQAANEYTINLKLFYNTERHQYATDPLLLYWKCKFEFLSTSILAPLIKKIEAIDSNIIELQSSFYEPGCGERDTYVEWLSTIKTSTQSFTVPDIAFYNKSKKYSPTLPLLFKFMEWDPSAMNYETYHTEKEFPAAPFIKQIKHTIPIPNPIECVSLYCLHWCYQKDKKWLTSDTLKIVDIILEKNKPPLSYEDIENQIKKYNSIRKDEYIKIRDPAYTNREILKDAEENLNQLDHSKAYYELQKQLPSTIEMLKINIMSMDVKEDIRQLQLDNIHLEYEKRKLNKENIKLETRNTQLKTDSELLKKGNSQIEKKENRLKKTIKKILAAIKENKIVFTMGFFSMLGMYSLINLYFTALK
jgi:hypothetical protein